ncbi:MAG: hypothetical protein N3A38_14500, partial [Planctomycetota bacterium]|nr:hypothetical protein [Planctomycetota bacterium]
MSAHRGDLSGDSWDLAHAAGITRRARIVTASVMGEIEVRLYPGESSYSPEQIAAAARVLIMDYNVVGISDYLMEIEEATYTDEYAVVLARAPDVWPGYQLPPGSYQVVPDSDPFTPYIWSPAFRVVTVAVSYTHL